MLKTKNLLIAIYGIFVIYFFLSMIFVGGFVDSRLSFIFHEISFYFSPYSSARTVTIPLYQVYQLSLLLFSFMLSIRTSNHYAKLGALCLSFSSVVGLALIRYPMDPPGTAQSAGGILHITLVMVMSLYIVTALLIFGYAFRHMKNILWLSRYSYSIAIVLFTAAFITGVLAVFKIPLVGMMEKLPVGAFLSWVVMVTFGFLRSDKRIHLLCN